MSEDPAARQTDDESLELKFATREDRLTITHLSEHYEKPTGGPPGSVQPSADNYPKVTTEQELIMTEEDNKRRQIRANAELYRFSDAEMRRVIASPGYTIARLTVQANRLIASTDTSDEARSDATKAQNLLEDIDRVAGE